MSSTSSPVRRSAPSSSSERVTSSTKNGLPSALRASSARSSAGTRAASSTRARHALRLELRERLEREPPVEAAVAEGMPVARPVRQQHERALGRHRVRQELEEFLGRLVDPVQVFDHEHEERAARGAQHPLAQRAEGLAAPRRRVHAVHRGVAAREREEQAHERQRPGERVSRVLLGRLDLRERAGLVVALVQRERVAEAVGDGMERGGARVRRAASLEPGVRDVREPAPELVQQARLAEARLADEEHDLAAARRARLASASRSAVELALAADERREARRRTHRDAIGHGALGERLEGADGRRLALHRRTRRDPAARTSRRPRAAWTRRSARRRAARASAGDRRDSWCRPPPCSPSAGRRRCCPRSRARSSRRCASGNRRRSAHPARGASGTSARWIASAATTARRGASSSASGAPNSAITPSPRNWFTVPS